ncbi:hypothetical protein LUZ60_011460 [Juncus effusus]|nr:hypothetical protein LUZ60_011460 [Juncus effusus]
MKAQGFPDRWITWIHQLLITSSSSLKSDGINSPFFFHQRGVHQGDPLSPLLFNIAINIIQPLIRAIDPLMVNISSIPTQVIQYADDTVFFVEGHPDNLKNVAYTLQLFSEITGLAINLDKNSFFPIAIPEPFHPTVSSILACGKMTLPINYLGLPLLLRGPKRSSFLPIIKRVQIRISAWKGRLLSKGGRLMLIKATLSAISIYLMQTIKIPKWVIKQIERLMRAFLWKGNDPCNPGNCLLRWGRVKLPKESGGLGIANLETQNNALLLKWLWKLDKDPAGLWAHFAHLLYGITGTTDLKEINLQNLSFFMKDLTKLLPSYKASTSGQDPAQPLSWRWNKDGSFSSKSAYNFLINPGIKCHWQKDLWKMKILPKVKFFSWLACHNKINTADNLWKKGWPHEQTCSLCGSTFETRDHLLISCSFTVSTWRLANRYNNISTAMPQGGHDFTSSWLDNKKRMGQQRRKKWETLWAAINWNIWKERNQRIFNARRRTPLAIARKALDEADLWSKHC